MTMLLVMHIHVEPIWIFLKSESDDDSTESSEDKVLVELEGMWQMSQVRMKVKCKLIL